MNSEILSAENELELINKYTRKPLKAQEVYTFTVTLCDNEIDRDFECFNEESLVALKELFVGKTGISDHSMRAKDQAARIYHCYIEKDPTRKNSKGQVYTALKARAYTVITDSTKSLIDEIDGGIKKEVSIGCAVNKITCSIWTSTRFFICLINLCFRLYFLHIKFLTHSHTSFISKYVVIIPHTIQ